MKRSHLFTAVPFVTGLLLLVSCKKDLYSGPIGSTYGQEFWTSQAAVEKATVAMYGQFRAGLRNAPSQIDYSEASYFVFGDLAAGVFSPAGGDVFLNYGVASPKFNFGYVPYWEESLHNWSRFYQVIAQSNLVLQNVPQMSKSMFANQAARNNYLAEALFMRAYTYFYMIRVWGDPVFVTKTYNGADYGNIPPLARTAEGIVLDSCLADLRLAAGYMNYGGGDPSKSIRANRGSAYALMAHMFEWKHQYDSAHKYCQQVINNGGYSLESMDNYPNIWKGQSSAESIFELPMLYSANDPNFKGAGDWAEAQFNCFGTFLKDSKTDGKKSSCWIAPAGGLFDNTLFDTTVDARYKSVFELVDASGGDDKGYMMTKYANFAYGVHDTKSYPYVNNDLVLLRLADIYLLDAEALAYLGNIEGARSQLAFTEDRAGITNYQNPTTAYDMIDEVVMERGRELIGEGQWYYDLVRTEYTQQWLEYIGQLPARTTPTAKGYYWPLDKATLLPYDNLLTQNTYWATQGR